MNMNEVSKHTQEVLKKNGWYEGREYDITFWVSVLEEEGYKLNEYAKSILLMLQVENMIGWKNLSRLVGINCFP